MNRRAALSSMLSTVAVFGLASCQGGGFKIPQPFGRVGGDNAPLSLAVQNKFRQTPELSAIRVEIFTRDEDVIILKGQVDTEVLRYTAEQVASTVDGVRRVDSVLFVDDGT